MLTSEAMLTLAAELADAQAHGDAELLAAIAWQLYGEVGEDLAEIARLRAAINAAWNRPHEQPDQRQLRPERDQAGLTAHEPRPATEQVDLCSGGFIAVCPAVECLAPHQAPVEIREHRLWRRRHGCSFVILAYELCLMGVEAVEPLKRS